MCIRDRIKLAPAGSDENASFRMVISYWDLVGSFITSGILNKELFFQSGRELLLVFERLREPLPSIRDAYHDPNYLKHLETIGLQFAEYWQGQNKTAYDAFLKRIK